MTMATRKTSKKSQGAWVRTRILSYYEDTEGIPHELGEIIEAETMQNRNNNSNGGNVEVSP